MVLVVSPPLERIRIGIFEDTLGPIVSRAQPRVAAGVKKETTVHVVDCTSKSIT
jgi:hypothetical protein